MMKTTIQRWNKILFAALLLFLCTSCSLKKTDPDEQQLFNSLLKEVTYDAAMTNMEDNVDIYFTNLPENTKVQFYAAGGYFADELVMMVYSGSDAGNTCEEILTEHIAQQRKQFLDYVPEEVKKIDHAVVKKTDKAVFLCITSDYKRAKSILSGETVVSEPSQGADRENSETAGREDETASANGTSGTMETTASETQADTTEDVERETQTNPSTEQAQTETGTMDTQLQPSENGQKPYPVLKSKTGEYHAYKDPSIRVDNSAFELYSYGDSAAQSYAKIVNETTEKLKGITQVYVLAIPTAIGVVLPDDIPEQLKEYSHQGEAIDKIYQKMSPEVKTVNCFPNLMMHRNEYLYFRTDFHWNGRGAYYAYESFCAVKGIGAIPLEERKEIQFPGFLGAIYRLESDNDPMLGNTPDTVEAFYPKSENAVMKITDRNGDTFRWDIIKDVSTYDASTKYSTFAGADNPLTEFENPDVTDGSVCIVVKESFGNALLPYLVDHYQKIYEIDYRYWKGNLAEFAKEKQATDLLFANNLSVIRSDYQVGRISEITR